MRLFLLDNVDSFTWNLVQAFRVLGAEVTVSRNDEVSPDAILGHDGLVISPGPGRPEDAGITLAAIDRYLGTLPILGVCLGHQALALSQGGAVVRAQELVHGKERLVNHDGSGLFAGLPSPLPVGRYHSLAVDPHTLPTTLQITAQAPDGEIMALRHRDFPAWGIQFHPESLLTPQGPQLLRNFLRLIGPVTVPQQPGQ